MDNTENNTEIIALCHQWRVVKSLCSPLKKQYGMHSIGDLYELRHREETDTEFPHVISPTKEDSILEETIKGKEYNRSIRYIKSLEFSTLTSRENK